MAALVNPIPERLLPIGRIAGLFGVHGELKVDPTTSGMPLFEPGAEFLARLTDGECWVKIAAVRPHHERLLIRLEGVDGATAARYIGATLRAERERVRKRLARDEILDVDLMACRLSDPQGRELGAIIGVEHYPSSPMLVVAPGRRLIPFVKAFICEIDLSGGKIVMDLPEGL